MDERSDQQLLREYVGRGSEEAFTTLVKRHTSLVYGTACRKLGDKSEAEEITQAVFVILARKAAFLCHRENLGGWLHQTTLLECRQQIRTDIRRQRREEIAMNMNTLGNESSVALEVDEALLELPEKDRQPLLLRFFESLSLRDVAGRMGIREDAAQKRVAKSLSLLERILRRRGRDIGSAALAVALAESAQAAPLYLAASAAQGALAATGTATAIGLAFGKFMALTKTQVATACLLAVGTPLLMEAQQLQAAREEARAAQATLAFQQNKIAGYSETVRTLQNELSKLELQRNAITAQIQEVRNGARPAAAPSRAALYRWSDNSAYVRLPKELLDGVRLTSAKQSEVEKRYGLPPGGTGREIQRVEPIDAKGNVSDALAEAFDLDSEERSAISGLLAQLGAQFDAITAQRTTVTNVMPPGIQFHIPEGYQLRTLVTHEFPEEGKQLKDQLVAGLERALGRERAGILMKQGHWALTHFFHDFGARQKWLSAAPAKNGMVTIGRSQTVGGVSTGSSVSEVKPDAVPESLRPFLPQSLFVNHE
jgi:RNA polymerase sigma factor (sigma-70 family)